MGKHAAPRPTRTARTRAATPTRTSTAAIPRVLQQTVAFCALAVVVAIVALVWSGTSAFTALAIGFGLLLLGAVAFLLIRRTGLLGGGIAGEPDDVPPSPL